MGDLGEEKQRAVEQWTQDPCGAVTGGDEFGTREFFDSVERARYSDYAPWMPSLMGFADFRGARLLEVGCGMGTDLLQFARGGADCVAIDLTPRSVETTRRRFALYGERGHFVVGDAERLPFADESFDVVYSNGVLHHTPDTAGAIREVHRVLRPGGVAKIMLYHRDSLAYWIGIVLRHGVAGGEFLRGHSPSHVLNRWAEYSEHGGCPLVKVYSRRQARRLFAPFREAGIEVEQLTRAELRVFKNVPEGLFRRLRRSIGWNLIITAKK